MRNRLAQWLEPIFRAKMELQPDERATLADLIWWKGEKVLVVEASLKVNGYDVMRAYKRVKTLRSVGVDAVGIAIGSDWASVEARELAKEMGVWWLIGETPSEGLLMFREQSGR